jgi:archaellum component FlaC
VTDELLARRILALEERLERVEAVKAPGQELVLDRLAELRQDTANRLDGMDSRLDGIDRRLDGMDSRLDGIDRRLDGMDSRLDGMGRRLDGIDRRLDGVDGRLQELTTTVDRRFDELAALIRSGAPGRREPPGQ